MSDDQARLREIRDLDERIRAFQDLKRADSLDDIEQQAFVHLIEDLIARVEALQQERAEAQAVMMPVLRCKKCGCLWRDNLDGTLSLFDAQQKSCQVCECKTDRETCDIHWLRATIEAQAGETAKDASTLETRLREHADWLDGGERQISVALLREAAVAIEAAKARIAELEAQVANLTITNDDCGPIGALLQAEKARVKSSTRGQPPRAERSHDER